MPDQDNIINALMDDAQQPTLADVVKNFLGAPRMQQFPTLQRTPGEGSAPLGEFVKSFGSSSPREPNFIDNALSHVPSDLAGYIGAASPFIGPRFPTLNTIRNQGPTAPVRSANDAKAGPLSVGGPSSAQQEAQTWLRMRFGDKKAAIGDMAKELEFQQSFGANANKARVQDLIEGIAILERQ